MSALRFAFIILATKALDDPELSAAQKERAKEWLRRDEILHSQSQIVQAPFGSGLLEVLRYGVYDPD